MGLYAAIRSTRWSKSVGEKTLHAGRFNIGPRLILGFVFIILSMLAGDVAILWQVHVVRTQAGRLNDVDQKLVAVLRVHTSMLAFHDRLDALAEAEDADRLLKEVGPLRASVLEEIRRAASILGLPPFASDRDPTILATLQVIESALQSQLEAITTLAASGDWRAVHLRLANQVRPLESLTSALVERVDHEAAEQQAQTVANITRVQHLVFWIVPLTALLTLLIAATLGLAITRSITQPLARLVEGSKALARGEFQHQVSVGGNDELAHLGQVFNDTARRLRDLYTSLQRSEERLRRVIDTIPAYAWSARPDGSVDFINQRFLEFTGRSMEDMLGWGWGSSVHSDDLSRYVSEWRSAIACGEAMESEVRLRRMDGNYRWLLIRNVPLRDELGNIVNWYGTSIDIEERRSAEDALRRSEAYLAEAQRLSKIGSFGWNVSTGEVLWSEESFRIFEYDRTTKPSMELIFQRVHPEDVVYVKQTIESASADGKDFEQEYRLLMPDNTVKYVHVVAHVVSDNSRRIEFVGALMDETERKRAEEALREAQANLARVSRVTTMGELTASLAHEIKQPITAAVIDAKTCLRWLGRDQPDMAKACEAARRIIEDVTRASEIISRIRLLFQQGTPQQEALDLNGVIEEMIVMLRSEAGRYSITIVSDLAPDLPKIMADRIGLQQVLMNLMLNAIEAMKDLGTPGKLTITSQQDEDRHLRVSVVDTGVGLNPEQTEQIFSAFFTSKAHGTGMGLPISRSIIRSCGGHLWATPNSGPGATFQFTLPIEASANQAA